MVLVIVVLTLTLFALTLVTTYSDTETVLGLGQLRLFGLLAVLFGGGILVWLTPWGMFSFKGTLFALAGALCLVTGLLFVLLPRVERMIVVTGKNVSSGRSPSFNIHTRGEGTWEAAGKGVYDRLQIGGAYRCRALMLFHQLEACRTPP